MTAFSAPNRRCCATGLARGGTTALPTDAVDRLYSAVTRASPNSVNWWRIWALWTGIGLLLVAEFVINANADWGRSAKHWYYPFVGQLSRAWLWALATPLVLRLYRAIPPKGWRNLAMHLLASLVAMAVVNLLRAYLITAVMAPVEVWAEALLTAHRDWWGPRALLDFAIYWGILAATHHLALRDASWRTENDNQHLRVQLAESELAVLKQQLQPHFLFNSLNAIAGLMRTGQKEKSVEAVALLAGLMRSLMVNSGTLRLTLARELEYIERYLAVEKVRFDDRLSVRYDIDSRALTALVPTLLLQPLVENALKHGLSPREAPGEIFITARVAGDRLLLSVENDLPERPKPAAPGHGLGLRSTRARLEKHHGTNQQFSLSGEGGRAKAVIEMPLETEPPTA
jgi:two-component system, LytTR family, sensor kinase